MIHETHCGCVAAPETSDTGCHEEREDNTTQWKSGLNLLPPYLCDFSRSPICIPSGTQKLNQINRHMLWQHWVGGERKKLDKNGSWIVHSLSENNNKGRTDNSTSTKKFQIDYSFHGRSVKSSECTTSKSSHESSISVKLVSSNCHSHNSKFHRIMIVYVLSAIKKHSYAILSHK